MHEMGMALQIAEIAGAAIPEHLKGVGVAGVNIRAGKLTAIVPESLRFCFEIAVKGTALDGAALRIEEVPVVARCQGCGHQWTIAEAVFICPRCSGGGVDIVSGRELDIVSVELAENE